VSARPGVARGLAWGLVNSLLLRLGNLGIGIVLARLLAPHDFGVYAVGLTVLSVLAAVAELGLTAQLVREGDIERRAPTANTLGLVVSSAMVVSVWIAAPALATVLGSTDATPVIRVLSLSLILSGLSAVPMAALQRRFLQSRQFVADFVSFVLTTVATLIMVEANFGAMSLARSQPIRGTMCA
jgi:lipopolysaccharide exporter